MQILKQEEKQKEDVEEGKEQVRVSLSQIAESLYF